MDKYDLFFTHIPICYTHVEKFEHFAYSEVINQVRGLRGYSCSQDLQHCGKLF